MACSSTEPLRQLAHNRGHFPWAVSADIFAGPQQTFDGLLAKPNEFQ
jgi:hypothetical protein